MILFSLIGIFCLQMLVIFVRRSNFAKADAIIILGHSLEEGEPSEWLLSRLYAGMELFFAGYAPYIITTGGQGPNDNAPVAYVMKGWLIANGIPEVNILVEPNSSSTFENFWYSQQILESYGIYNASIIISTNYFHLHRSEIIANVFFDTVYTIGSPVAPSFSAFLYYIREPAAIVKFGFDFLIYKFF